MDDGWEGFTEAATAYNVTDARLWTCLIQDVTSQEAAQEPPLALVSVCACSDGFADLQAFRPCWRIKVHSEQYPSR